VAGGEQTSHAAERRAEVVAVAELGLAGMQRHAHPQLQTRSRLGFTAKAPAQRAPAQRRLEWESRGIQRVVGLITPCLARWIIVLSGSSLRGCPLGGRLCGEIDRLPCRQGQL